MEKNILLMDDDADLSGALQKSSRTTRGGREVRRRVKGLEALWILSETSGNIPAAEARLYWITGSGLLFKAKHTYPGPIWISPREAAGA